MAIGVGFTRGGGEGTDFYLEVAKGNVPGHSGVNKFGRNVDVDTGSVPEDIWDGGGVWVAPTTARTHDVASSSASDASAGTGARTIRLYGLTAWDQAEASEDVILNGITNVPTANAYVILHRMLVLTAGSGGSNAGNITATAQTDGTVTAQISIGFGQTLMAVYGLPSTQKFYMDEWYGIWARSGGAANEASLQLYVKENADQSDGLFVVKHDIGLFGSGSTYVSKRFFPQFGVTGPAIIKVQVETVSANNTDLAAGFDGVLVDNSL